MELTFEKGSAERPKGHALLYFKSSSAPEELWATYLVILPIMVDLSKYVPPFLMNQVGELGAKDLSGFAFPPVPEKLGGSAQLAMLAETRDDDVLFGGSINLSDLASAMTYVNEAVQRYADAYSRVSVVAPEAEAESFQDATGPGVNEVLYGLMSDGDRLSELTKLVGKLRFAVESAEETLENEAEADIQVLSRYLPENHQVDRLIETAKAGGDRGAKLADLYLRRCFHLIHEEYVKMGKVEQQIGVLEAAE